jgi:DNA repair exonuclease SbcCD ATPase subunit
MRYRMTDPAPAELPLQIDRVHGSRPAAGEIRLVLTGHWRAEPPVGGREPLLVIQLEGRRHRFAAERAQAEPPPDGAWSATFAIPDWAEPRQEGQAAVWVGRHVVPLPPLRSGPRAVPPPLGAAVPLAEQGPAAPACEQRSPAPVGDISRSGPLADMLLKDTVSALHEELGQRTAETARLRGALADAQAELETRASTQAQLERTVGELSDELRRLMAAVEEHAAELAEATGRHAGELAAIRRELAAAQVARDAALSEAAGLRGELSRVGAELAVSREKASSESGDLAEASRLLADAKALASRLRDESSTA